MYFANPWGLLGLLALPAIVAIHLYHRRFPPLEIAGLHLWSLEMKKDSPGRTKERLPITRSLLLELLAALLITLLIADPRDSSVSTRPHLVVVLDDSASMSAVEAGTGISSRERAKEWLLEQQPMLGRGGVISVLKSGVRPTLIAGPRATWEEMVSSLEEWQPEATKHAFEPAWDLAAQLAADEAELVFLTDKLPGEEQFVPERMEVRSFGRTLDNVAITAARWLYDSETGEGTLFVRLANLGDDATTVAMTATSGKNQLINESIELPAGVEKSMQWGLPGGLGQIELKAEAPDDPLEIDHTIQLVEPEVRLVTVSVTLPSTHSGFDPIKRILGVIPDLQLGDPGEADLIISMGGDEAPRTRGLWWLGVGPLDPAAKETSRTLIGPYLIEKQHPLMNGIVLGGVVWGGVQNNPENVVPIISSGTRFLFSRLADHPAQAYLMNIDLAESNLTESPDWPIFWTNLIEQCRNSRPGFRRWNFRLEESIPFTLDPARIDAYTSLTLAHNGETKPLIRMESVEIPPRDAIGIYTVKDGDEEVGQFAVNFFDRAESDLSSLKPGVGRSSVGGPALGIHLDNPFSWLLVLGILLVISAAMYDWFLTRK